ncbi:MAG: succinate dehydrogenase, hydrophobic membrane anchor protein [SAR86 cluster bacterium]|uniref:Succinate dehydrogenase hydrophobic membrane anchor subunit n=1 Tax=SAR86 cluster bacterium TaxID=2030880 RepID=A0A2A5B3N3_9GAMM|nr:MAG: succinate dehydrogenase, hydrophobic membrane anchor protein [SAR86 cluster bacterium]
MVTSVTNLGRSGLYDWLVQRLSAVILAAYSLCILASFVLNPDMDYEQWSSIFESNVMRIFSMITLFALCAHAWIGMWTISTDYLTTLQLGKRATFFRLLFQASCALLICVYLLWGIQIFWGN